jgi:multidrug efflux system membrane fusion protein
VINRLGAATGGGGSAPANSLASYTAPQETAPQETTPEETAPQRTTPEEPAAEEPAPRRTAPEQDAPPQSPGSGDGAAPEGGAGPRSGTGGGSDTPHPDSGSADPVTLTSAARPGSVVGRGGVLYRVDGEPVVLMYGPTPAYRDLAAGAEGRDVLQLERNLAALGFEPGAVDSSFSSETAAAVSRWQEANQLPETGTVELGRVVFLPGERRVGEREATVGAPLSAGAEVMETTSTRRVVTVELDATRQSLAREGAGVEVTLPSQSTVRGRIASVGRVARELESSSGAATPDGSAEDQQLVIDVTVRLRSLRGAGRLDEAPVSVALASESARGVLAVPVAALAARPGGGYGLELAASGRIVPVEAGLFAGGYVEDSGRGIREGTRVAVPDA